MQGRTCLVQTVIIIIIIMTTMSGQTTKDV